MRTPFCECKTRRGGVRILSYRSQRNKKTTELFWARLSFYLAQEEGFEPPCLLGKRFSRLLTVVVSSGYFMAAWLISVPLKSLSHKAFCLVLNRSNPNRINSNRTAFLKISLKSLTFERIWRELDTKKFKMQYSEVGLYWREFLP